MRGGRGASMAHPQGQATRVASGAREVRSQAAAVVQCECCSSEDGGAVGKTEVGPQRPTRCAGWAFAIIEGGYRKPGWGVGPTGDEAIPGRFRAPRGGVQINGEVIRMRAYALLLVFMAPAVVPTAWASECFSIQDSDLRNSCLASTKKDKSYCFKIRDADMREGCLAPLQGETYGCFKIQVADTRAACLGETKEDSSYCFKIPAGDERNVCLARVKWDRSYCFKIEDENLRKDCLASIPR